MGDIQNLVEERTLYDQEQVMIYDSKGTVIGSTDEAYLRGSFYSDGKDQEAFSGFKRSFEGGFNRITKQLGNTVKFKMNNETFYGCVLQNGEFSFLILVPS